MGTFQREIGVLKVEAEIPSSRSFAKSLAPFAFKSLRQEKNPNIFSDQVLRKRPARQLFNSSAFTGL
jgi:hypothetical protein